MKTKLNLGILAFVIIIVSSCTKEIHEYNTLDKDVINTNPEELNIDPYYGFADLDAYDKAIDMIIESNLYNADVLFKADGFKSYAAIYEEFAEKAHSIKCEKEYKKLLEEYSDIIRIEDDVIFPRIANPLIRNLVNRQGIVKVGPSIYLYGESEKLISVNGSVEDLILAKESKSEMEGILRFDYHQIKSSNITVACGSYQSNDRRYNRRRAIISSAVEVHFHPIPNTICVDGHPRYRFRTIARTVGTPLKRNIWGNWVNYRTINEIHLRYRARNNLGQSKLITFDRVDTRESSGIIHSELIGHEGYGCWSEQGNYQGTFEWINKNRYKHRGMNNNWAEIYCGHWFH